MKFLVGPSPILRYRNRSIRITPEGILFLFLTLLVGITAINTGNNLLYLLMGLMLTLIVISGVLSEWCLKGIRVEHRLPSQIFARDPVACRWSIRNKKSFFPSFTLKTTLLYPDMIVNQGAFLTRVLAGSTLTCTSSLAFGRRGIFHPKGYELCTAFPFGFFEKTLTLPAPGEVVVYPRIQHFWMVQGSSVMAGDTQEVRRKGWGQTLYNLRDYQQGDDSRNIHWKTSARKAKLLVKEQEQEDERKIQICLSNQLPVGARAEEQKEGSSDTPTPRARPGQARGSLYPPVGARAEGDKGAEMMEDFEEAVSLAASLVHTFIQKGYRVGISTLDREIHPKQGMAHCNRILQLLALVNPLSVKEAPKGADRFSGRLSRAHQMILILPWEDPGWKAREACFTKVITPSQWRRDQTREMAG